MSKLFIIHPIRKADDEITTLVKETVEHLEKVGYEVYDPERDTPQEDETGLRICEDNLKAIKECDEVWFFWDGKSQGCLFDLGMAFALDKPVFPFHLPPLTDHKSFQNMVLNRWNQRYHEWGTRQ